MPLNQMCISKRSIFSLDSQTRISGKTERTSFMQGRADYDRLASPRTTKNGCFQVWDVKIDN